jgi:(p)ppGpp synthase/HD superfamily hydrolase
MGIIILQKAILFATAVHVGQTRKGKSEVPYITHPLAVALILARVGASEDVITAGILHDTVEDSHGKVAVADISREFGDAVAKLVDYVTEKDHDLLSWEERKSTARAHIADMSHDALLLKSADILYNLRDLLADLEETGEEVWLRFNAPKEKQIEHHMKLAVVLSKVWPENPLLSEVQTAVGWLKSLPTSL